MVGDFSCAIVTIHNFRSLQDLPQKMWRESLRSCHTIARMHYEAKEYASHPRTHHTHSVVISVLKDQLVIIINGDKQLLSTEG